MESAATGLPACGEGDDLDGVTWGDGVVAVFFSEEGLAVEFDDEWFAEKVEGLELVGGWGGGVEGGVVGVGLDGREGDSVVGICYWGAGR